jgi:hypothetical protein
MMKRILLSLLAVFLLLEEWLWDILTAFGQQLARWLHLAKFERWLSRASPGVALVAFAIPLLIVTPVNLLAFWLLAHGLVLQGILVEVLAKLLGTLLVARVFALTKPQLLTFSGFARVYITITGWLRWAHARITETTVYRLARQVTAQIKAGFRAWVKRNAT